MTTLLAKFPSAIASIGNALQSVLLLVIRLWWGASFCRTGFGKLIHLDRIAAYFGNDLHIPMPKLNALLAGSTECFGGFLIVIGLCSRIASLPLIFTLCVAYATAERDALFSIFSDPDKFTGATPFLFLLAMLIVFAFGPGKFSLDALLFGRSEPAPVRSTHREAAIAR